MPGPVSQSNPGQKDLSFKDEWLAYLRKEGSKFFVLKCIDFLECLSAEEVIVFNMMLKKHEEYRRAQDKPPFNRYWVVNRDEHYSHFVKEIIEEHEGIKLKDSEDEDCICHETTHGKSCPKHPLYAAGFRDSDDSYGMFDGPTPHLTYLLNGVPPDNNADEAREAFIILLGEDKPIWRWDEDECDWIKIED
jgi:hypothetical protein